MLALEKYKYYEKIFVRREICLDNDVICTLASLSIELKTFLSRIELKLATVKWFSSLYCHIHTTHQHS